MKTIERTETTTWNHGKYINVEVGQKVLVYSCGSGFSYFGEFATLTKITEKHLVFKTESGVVIRTKEDNLNALVGKAKQFAIMVDIEGIEDDENFYHDSIVLF